MQVTLGGFTVQGDHGIHIIAHHVTKYAKRLFVEGGVGAIHKGMVKEKANQMVNSILL